MSTFGFEMSAPTPTRKRAWPWFFAFFAVILGGLLLLARTLQPAADYSGTGGEPVVVEVLAVKRSLKSATPWLTTMWLQVSKLGLE